MADEQLDPFATARKLSFEGISVVIATPIKDDNPWRFTLASAGTIMAIMGRGIPLDVHVTAGGVPIPWARNKILHNFLQSTANRLFMIDSDISWQPEDGLKLIALSTKMDIVCAAYSSKSEPALFMLAEQEWEKGLKTNEWGCLPINGLGLGFCIITREVAQTLANRAPLVHYNMEPEPIREVFKFEYKDNPEMTAKYKETVYTQQGEDIGFFRDARDAGFGVWLDPNITLGHTGPKTYTASIKDTLRKVEPNG